MTYGKFAFGCLVAAALSVTAAHPSFADDATTPTASPSPTSALWLGGMVKNRADAAFAGGVWSPMSNLDSDGILVRGSYVYVNYRFSSGLASNGRATGQLNGANAEVGYQIVRYGLASSLLVGPDFQDFSTSPSSAEDHKLTQKIGLGITGRVARQGSPEIPASLEGTFSTANTAYWTMAKVGYNFGKVTIGPEIGALGNVSYDEGRYGAFVSITLAPGQMLQAGLGYSQEFRRGSSGPNGGEGAYGELSFVLLNY